MARPEFPAGIYEKYGIPEDLFDFSQFTPSAIGWLSEGRFDLPQSPGYVFIGVEQEVVLLKLVESSLYDFVNGLLDDADFYRQFDTISPDATRHLNSVLEEAWIAFEEIRFTLKDGS